MDWTWNCSIFFECIGFTYMSSYICLCLVQICSMRIWKINSRYHYLVEADAYQDPVNRETSFISPFVLFQRASFPGWMRKPKNDFSWWKVPLQSQLCLYGVSRCTTSVKVNLTAEGTSSISNAHWTIDLCMQLKTAWCLCMPRTCLPRVPKVLIVFYLFNMMEYANQASNAEIKLALGCFRTNQTHQINLSCFSLNVHPLDEIVMQPS